MKYAFRCQVYEEPLEDSLSRLNRLGYDGVELLGEPDGTDANELSELLTHYKLGLSHLNGNFLPETGRDLVSRDAGVRRDTLDYCRRCITFAHQFGARSFELRPSPEEKPAPTAPLSEEWQWAVDALVELAPFATSLGVGIAIEPATRYEVYMVNTIDDALRMIADVGEDNVGILADCFHMNIEDADIPQSLRKAGSRLLNVHIADSNRMPAGRGHTDFLAIMRTLKEIGYDGYLTMEPVPSRGEVLAPSILDSYYEESLTLMRLYEGVV